jgi:tetratricopeptide (TPR) repeat protein
MREASKMAPESKATYQWAFMGQITNRLSESQQAFDILDPERGAMRGWAPYWNIRAEVQHRLGDFDAEHESGTKARELYPERPDPRQIQISALAAQAKLRDIEKIIDAAGAASTDTLSPGHIMAYAAVELGRHRHDAESQAMFDRALQWFKQHLASGADSTRYLRDYAEVLTNAKRWEEARPIVERLQRADPQREQYRAWQGILAAATGRREEALQVEAWLSGLQSVRLYHNRSNTYQRARIWALLGDRSRALQLTQQAFSEGYGIPRHPDVAFEKMRDDKELQQLYAPRN